MVAPPLPELEPWDAVRWLQRNKVPLIGVVGRVPARVAADPTFKAALGLEQEAFAVQRQQYQIVHDAWDAEGIQALMIKSAGDYPAFPYNSDNLDLLVRPEHGQTARDVLRRLGYVELRNIEEPWKYLFRRFVGGRCVAAIHVHEQVAW